MSDKEYKTPEERHARIAEIEEEIRALMHVQNNSDWVSPQAIERSRRVNELGTELKALHEEVKLQRPLKVLVTGGAGFIGSHIAQRYLEAGHEVAVLDDLSTGLRENIPTGALFWQGDITDAGFVCKIMQSFQPHVVSHQAARISVADSMRNPSDDARVNVVGALNVLQAAVACGASRFIFASSAAVYGEPEYLPIDEGHPRRPSSPYGVAKSTVEDYLGVFRKRICPVVLRYANVYGSRQTSSSAVSAFARALSCGDKCVIYGDGSMTRDYVFVGDVAEANLRALHCARGTFNISTGVGTSTLALFEAMRDALGKPEQEPVFEAQRQGDVLHSVLSNARAKSVLGWSPQINIREGVRCTLGQNYVIA